MKKALSPKTREGRKKGAFGITDAEWDFSEKTIPRNSVHECLLYEYARELIRRSPEASRTLKKLQEADCSGDRGLFWDSYEEMRSVLKTKQSSFVSVYQYMDEVPWTGFRHQLEKERKELIKRRKPVRQQKSVGKDKKGEPTAETRKSDAEESDAIYLGECMVLMSSPTIDRCIIHDSRLHGYVGKLFTKFDLQFASFFDADYLTEQSRGFFAVDLKARIPDALADFKAWFLKEKKRAGIVDAERRGRTNEADKAYKSLKALGAYRLMTLTKFSAAGIMDTFNELKRPPLYSNAPEWSRAKKSVEATMRELFVIPEDAIF